MKLDLKMSDVVLLFLCVCVSFRTVSLCFGTVFVGYYCVCCWLSKVIMGDYVARKDWIVKEMLV